MIFDKRRGFDPNSVGYPHDRLVALRKTEATQAAHHLGLPPGRLGHLDLPDTRAPSEGPAFEQAVDRIMDKVRESGATSVLVTWEGDPHGDHVAAARMARALRTRNPGLRLWFYPIWGWHLDPGTDVAAPAPTGFRFDIGPWLDAKRAAIAAHRSQMTGLIDDDPEGFRFNDVTLAPFLKPFEYFFEVPR